MPGYLERTIEFAPEIQLGLLTKFETVEDQISPPLRSLGLTAMNMILCHGGEYDAGVSDFTRDGPRADADTPVGAGSVTLDLLRYVNRASQADSFKIYQETHNLRDIVETTLIHTVEDVRQKRQCGEVIGSARRELPVNAAAINYTQERDSFGNVWGPTALHLTAQVGSEPVSETSLLFTNVSMHDCRTVGGHLSEKEHLTVSASQLHALSLHPPDYPVTFHYLRAWTEMLQIILDR